jgi:alpha-1,2-mannosyltransferase
VVVERQLGTRQKARPGHIVRSVFDTYYSSHTGENGGPSGGLIGGSAWLVIIAATVLGLVSRAFVLTRPGFLTSGAVEYDDGVYLGAAVRILQGALPYRDFAFVQPPGILILSLPAAALARVATTSTGLLLVRVLTVGASTACIPLVGNLVRYRGTLVTVAACGILAVYPADVMTARTLLLEPWMNLCCLLGANAAFRRGQLASPRRLAWAGVALGFAVAIKFWAAVPAVLLLGCCLLVREERARRTRNYVVALAASVIVPLAPFALGAPLALVRGTLFDQVTRVGDSVSLSTRLAYLSGVIDVLNRRGGFASTVGPNSVFAMASNGTMVSVSARWLPFAATAVVIIVLAVGYLRAPRRHSHLELFALTTAVVSATAILGYSAFFYHYPAFPAPWLAIAVGAAVGVLVGRRMVVQLLAVVASVVVILAVAGLQVDELAGVRIQEGTAIGGLIPAGACVVTDQISFTIAADRFTAARPGCPDIVDALATTLTISHGVSPRGGAASLGTETAAWRSIFGRAQYVWLSGGYQQRIPWPAGLRAWFARNFRLIGSASGYSGSKLYVRAP